jgi:hypothetical protein
MPPGLTVRHFPQPWTHSLCALVGSQINVPDDDKDAEPYAPMRCMECGREMVLINAIEDWTMPVIGFERHAYMCSACGAIEKRTVFSKQAKEKHEAEIAAALAPPIVPTATTEKHPTAQGFFGRVLAKIRGR